MRGSVAAWKGALALGLGLGMGQGAKAKPAEASKVEPYLGYFCESYEACRAQFRDQVAKHGTGLAGFKAWSTPLDEAALQRDLTVDFAYFPARQSPGEKLLLVTSGIHGVEGYAGSAVQAFYMNTMLEKTLAEGVSVLFVHGINAYGFRADSRYTENRVDLNRNWFLTKEFPSKIDDRLYDDYKSLFTPDWPATFSSSDFYWFAVRRLVPYLRSAQDGRLTQASGQGQYHDPHGIIYGGDKYEPHRDIFLAAARSYLAQARTVLHLDLHTGLGRREMQLLPNPPFRPEVEELRKTIFTGPGLAIEATGNSNFYSSHGDFSDFVCRYVYAQAEDKRCVNMLLEYGTLMETYWQEWPWLFRLFKENMAQAYTLYLVIRENQLHHHDAASDGDRERLVEAFRSLFYPEDREWRVMVLHETLVKWPGILERFAKLEPSH